jgi:hypothetical protein
MQTHVLLPIAWTACIHLAAWGVGRMICARCRGGRECPSALATMLGLVALAAAAFVLAAARALHAPLLVASVLVLAGIGAWAGRARLARAARAVSSYRPSWRDLPFAAALLFAASFLPNALYPLLEHDDNVYHLLLPKVYLREHGLTYLPSNLFANMPHLVEMLYAAAMACGDFVAPKVLVWSIAFWTLVALYAAVRPALGRFAAGIVPLLFVSGKNVQWHLGLAYVEPVIGFLLLSAAIALVRWWETRDDVYLRLLAVAAGAAMASKYSAWGFALVILVVAVVARARAGAASRGVAIAAQMAGIVLALVGPWLAKNLIYTGNPIFPNLYGLLGGRYWSSVQEMHLLRSQSVAGGAEKTLATMLALPYQLVTKDTLFYCPSSSIALMALFLIALASRAAWRPPRALVTAAAALGFAVWALSVQQGRFLVAWVPVMALAAAAPLEALRARPRAAAAIVALVAVAGAWQLAAQLYPYTPRFDVFTAPRADIERRNGNFALCQHLNANVPPGARVLVMWDNRFFFLEREFQADSAYEAPTGLARLRASGDAVRFAQELLAAGFTHVVVNVVVAASYLNNETGFDLLHERLYPLVRLEQDRALVDAFVTRCLVRETQQGNLVAFRIREELRGGAPAAR